MLTYEQKRLALHAMNLTVKVWATSYSPRCEIQVEPPVLGETREISDPQSDCGDGHDEGRANVSSRRDCASKGDCRVDLP